MGRPSTRVEGLEYCIRQVIFWVCLNESPSLLILLLTGTKIMTILCEVSALNQSQCHSFNKSFLRHFGVHSTVQSAQATWRGLRYTMTSTSLSLVEQTVHTQVQRQATLRNLQQWKGCHRVMVYKCPCRVLKERLDPSRTKGCSKRCEFRAILVDWLRARKNGEQKLQKWKTRIKWP